MRATSILVVSCVAVLGTSQAAFAQRWGRGPVPRDGACFYKDADFHGDYFCVRTGDTLESIPRGLNDEISSIRLYGRSEVTVFKDHLSGKSRRFERDVRNLKNEGWNDTVSSVDVRFVRGSRPGGSAADADRIVRRAYDDLLARQPDPDGLRHYRSLIIDDGWTEAEVRDAIRKSPEYREKHTMTPAKAQEIVRQAYLNVLKREPDPASGGWVTRVMRDKWTQADVERELRKTPEYRNR
jgi:hypothetical protein